MLVKSRLFNVFVALLVVINLALVNVSVAFADDGAPPEPTPTVAPTEDPITPPVTETATPEPDITETPTPEETATPLPEETVPSVEETPLSEEPAPPAEEAEPVGLLSQLPENTEIVVLDQSGESIPLVSQDALDAMLDTDPMWCPAGVLPGGAGCTTNFASIALLLTDMRNNTLTYDQDGIIYFTANPGASFALTTAGASLGAGDFNTLNDFNLTLQGGWNGSNGALATFTGQTNFGTNTVTIGTSANPWAGNITLNNFTFSGVSSSNAVTVYTTSGNIILNNVDVAQQSGDNYTAYLDSTSGNITVQNGSSFDGNNSGANQNRGFYADTNTGSITITGTSGTPITFNEAHGCLVFIVCLVDTLVNYNGATLNAPTVTLNYVSASNNDLNGFLVTNANTVTLNNVTTNNNGTNLLLQPDTGDVGSGVQVNGTGSTIVNVFGGSFTNNERYGVEVTNGSISITTAPTCSGNDLGCLKDNIPPVLSLPANITAEAASASGAAVTYTTSATDNIDGTLPATCAPVSGSTFAIGTTTVNCSATDSNAFTTHGSFTVTVQDTTVPTLNLPANITIEATGPSGEVVTYTASASDLVAGSVPVTCVPASGSTFLIGTTTVNCSATDTYSNTANGSFNVTVTDITAPTLTLPANITLEATSPSGAAATFSVSSIDIVDGSVAVICSPASGTTFALGVTTVNCTATDSHSNTANGSFTVTIQDTTVPVISFHADIFLSSPWKNGRTIAYAPPAVFDIADGASLATCTPASGSRFFVGITVVTCTAIDSHGNAATPVTFNINLTYSSQTSTNGLFVPVTGGGLIDLDCFTIINNHGIKVSLHNLCNHQAAFTHMDAATLPAQLPDGFTFANGLNVDILFSGQSINELPSGAGVQLDFPISANTQDQYAALLWDEESKAWLNVTQLMKDDELSKMLSTDAEDELYQVIPTETMNAFYRILTTEETGTLVIVKK